MTSRNRPESAQVRELAIHAVEAPAQLRRPVSTARMSPALRNLRIAGSFCVKLRSLSPCLPGTSVRGTRGDAAVRTRKGTRRSVKTQMTLAA